MVDRTEWSSDHYSDRECLYPRASSLKFLHFPGHACLLLKILVVRDRAIIERVVPFQTEPLEEIANIPETAPSEPGSCDNGDQDG